MQKTGPAALVALAVVTTMPVARAGHPMLSEDTGTQGINNAELELGYAWSREDDGSIFLFQPQLSYGTGTTVDLIVQPSWTVVNDPYSGHHEGFGDTNLDFKWRFYGAAPWALGVRAGLEVPTAQYGLGLPHHRVSPHGLLVITGDFAPLTVDANLGYTRVPDDLGARADLLHFSAALTWQANEHVAVVLDSAVDSNPDGGSSTPPWVALLGVIYTIRPGLDLDVGYRGGLNSVAPIRQFLLGITVRGGL